MWISDEKEGSDQRELLLRGHATIEDYGTVFVDASETTPDRDHDRCWLCMGRAFKTLARYTEALWVLYTLVLSNILMLVGFLLVCKYWSWEPYRKWMPWLLPLNDWYFQLANLFLVFSYTIGDLLALRICLFYACIFFTLFGLFGLGDIAPDAVIYNALMSVINMYYIVSICWKRRYIEFEPEWEKIYVKVFEPIGVTRSTFETLQSKGLIRWERQGTIMHDIGDSVTSLCILVKGTVELYDSKNTKANTYRHFDILEGVEWVHGDLDPHSSRFEHKFQAQTDVIFVKWNREALVKLFDEDPDLETHFRIILGLGAAKNLRCLLRYRISVDLT